jgi:hypothetical protein
MNRKQQQSVVGRFVCHTPLPVRISPLQDECFGSWFLRLTIANAITPGELLVLIGVNRLVFFHEMRIVFKPLSPEHFSRLAELAGFQANELRDYFQIKSDSYPSQKISLSHKINGVETFDYASNLKFCPACWRDDPIPYVRQQWLHSDFLLCPLHHCLMHLGCKTDGCPSRFPGKKSYRLGHCDHIIRIGIHQCVHCKNDLREQQAHFVPSDVGEVIGEWHRFFFQDPPELPKSFPWRNEAWVKSQSSQHLRGFIRSVELRYLNREDDGYQIDEQTQILTYFSYELQRFLRLTQALTLLLEQPIELFARAKSYHSQWNEYAEQLTLRVLLRKMPLDRCIEAIPWIDYRGGFEWATWFKSIETAKRQWHKIRLKFEPIDEQTGGCHLYNRARNRLFDVRFSKRIMWPSDTEALKTFCLRCELQEILGVTYSRCQHGHRTDSRIECPYFR